jgi:hypothetical protein
MGRTRTSLEAHDANTYQEYKGRKARGVEVSNNYQNHQVIPFYTVSHSLFLFFLSLAFYCFFL